MIRSILGGLVLGAVAYAGLAQWVLPQPEGPAPGDTLRILGQPQPLIQAPALVNTIRSVGRACSTVTQAVEQGRVETGDVLWSARCPEGDYGIAVHPDGSARILTCRDFAVVEHRACFSSPTR